MQPHDIGRKVNLMKGIEHFRVAKQFMPQHRSDAQCRADAEAPPCSGIHGHPPGLAEGPQV